MQFNDPNAQPYARLKKWAQKHHRIFIQHADPDRAVTPEHRSPSQRASRKSRDCPVRLRTQLDRVVWGEPSWRPLHHNVSFVN